MISRRFFPYAITCALAVFAFSTVASAQATRTWVSGVGDDVNPCSRTAPCKTWAGAISKTARGGEINALDPGGFGTLTITKSITIDGAGTHASTLNSSITGFLVNITDPADTAASVIIRNVSVNGAGTTPGTQGVRIAAGRRVVLENVTIFGNGGTGTSGRGVSDVRTSVGGGLAGVGSLQIINCTIMNNQQSNVVINPSAGNTVNATIANSRLLNSTSNSGLAVSSGGNVLVRDTVIAGNFNFGIFAEELSGAVDINVENTTISNNGTGVSAAAGPIVRLSNVMIAGNSTGVTGAGVFSWQNNRISGNNVGNGPVTLLSPLQQ